MFISKSIILAFVASSTSVGAFITPKSEIGIHKELSTSGVSRYKPGRAVDHSLKFWKKDEEVQQDTSSALSDKSDATEFDNGKNDLIAPGIYAAFTGILIYIIYQLRDALVLTTIGSKALALVTGALIWDNMIIALGSLFFKDAKDDPEKYEILRILSFPRFTLHAVAVPFQVITIAEMGKAAGLGFLQSDLLMNGLAAVALIVAIADRKAFVDSGTADRDDNPRVTLDTFDDSPFSALERDLTKFTYSEFNIAFLLPVIVLTLANLIVGISIYSAGTNPEIAQWMLFSAITALVGNALPGSIATFSGNLGEIGMQYGLLQAARIVYGGGML